MNILKLFLVLFSLFFLFGCNATKATLNETDMTRAMSLALALGAAGFEGDFDLKLNASLESGLKEAFYLDSGGSSLNVRGHIDPSNTNPEQSIKYLEVLKALREKPTPRSLAPDTEVLE